MKKYILVLSVMFFALLSQNLCAEERYPETIVHGHVLLKGTGEHVPFVLVSLKGTTIATSTGDSGHYHLEHLPSGTFTIQVSGMGYKTVSRDIVLKPGTTLEINFELEEDNVLHAHTWLEHKSLR